MTPLEMLQKMKAGIGPRTGRSWEEWVEVARASGLDKHKAITDWLKAEHGLNHNEAQWVAWEVTDPGRAARYDQPKDLTADLYSGKKAHLRPVYDALLAAGLGLGADVTSFVCKTYTSLSAGVQFAILNPRTLGGVDLELRLPADHPWGERFKSSNPNFQHRRRIADPAEIDDALLAAMAAADHERRLGR